MLPSWKQKEAHKMDKTHYHGLCKGCQAPIYTNKVPADLVSKNVCSKKCLKKVSGQK